MSMRTAVVVAVSTIASVAVAAPASAASTDSATLACGSASYEVTGFGRGQVLHVVGSTDRFVVTRAELSDGTVVFDNPGQTNATDILTCSATSPISQRAFTFEGFFAPRS